MELAACQYQYFFCLIVGKAAVDHVAFEVVEEEDVDADAPL